MTPARRGWAALLGAAISCIVAAPLRAQGECAATPAARGAWPAPLDRVVTLRAREISLRDALDRLSATAGVRLSYASDLVPLERRVCVSARRQPLGDALAGLVAAFRVEPEAVAGQAVLVPARAAEGPARERVDVLEAIVVTGSPTARARRSLPIAMDAVEGRGLERRAASELSDVLNASAPGVWAWRQSPSTLLARYASVRGASSFGATYPKVYVDGIEAANPLLVTEIDPETVERVEVIRGPQGAALYGSDAISGVVNVVTRHGVEGSARAEVSSRGGFTGSDYAASPLPTHDARVMARAGTNLRSAGGALTLGGAGAVYPGAETRKLGAVANGRWVGRRIIGTATLRFAERTAGAGRNPLFAGLGARDSLEDAPRSLRRYTVGGSATVAGDGRWTHTLLAGVDGYRLENVAGEGGPVPLATQSALLTDGGGDRGTLRASSTLRLGDGADGSGGTVALSVEHSVLRQRSATREPPAGPRQPEREPVVLEEWRHATGVVAQTSGSWRNTLFATAGLRVERNDAFASGSSHATLPMLGGAWVREVGGAEVKLRAAYGRGIRPPRTPARAHLRPDGGAEPALALEPEAQSGVEVGAELYAGRALSLGLTRFDQRATGLIQDVAVGVDTAARAGGGAPIRRVRYELQNVGAISNRGWEMQGTAARGPLALSATMALVDSRVRTVAPRYLGDLRPGDRMLAVPARTASLAAEWSGGPWSAALTATRAWDWINYDRLALARDFAGRLRLPREMTGAALRGYWREYDGSTELRAAGTRQVTPRLALTVVADNLLGNQLDEPDNVTIRPGRAVTLGVRATF